MTLPSSGPLTLGGTATNAIQQELSLSGIITINDTPVRTLLQAASGLIAMNEAYGKQARKSVTYTYTSTIANSSINIATLSGYVAGISDVVITINSGVYLWASTTAYSGLSITGGTTGDTVRLINNGYIMGHGGAGGIYAGLGSANGSAGTPALSIGFDTLIDTSSGYILGGGGGGGSAYNSFTGSGAGGGGGAGGANGGYVNTGANGVGGALSANGTNGGGSNYYYQGGGGGGRVVLGTDTAGPFSLGAPGYGGSAGGTGATCSTITSGPGAGTGGAGKSITTGGNGLASDSRVASGGGGGGWGQAGGSGYASGSLVAFGGAAGKAVALNGHNVTWIGSNNINVYGPLA